MSTNWIDRINQQEAAPPKNGWEKIVAALDDSLDNLSFPKKLHTIQTTPPVASWAIIENALNVTEKSQPAPIKKIKLHPVIRYAVAASFIAAIAVTAYFITSNWDQQVAVQNQATKAIQSVIAPSSGTTSAPVTAHTPEQKDEEALEQSKHTYARLDLSRKSSGKDLHRLPAQLTSFLAETEGKQPELQYSHRAAISDLPSGYADRYALFQDNDGRVIRISKKLSNSDLFCCVTGEIINDKCNDLLKQWREKIASSPFTPSPGNFMDILDLIHSIQDNIN